MTKTQIQTTNVTTVTTDCEDHEVRAVLSTIRHEGGFILSSGPTSKGYRVVHTEYK